jgi:hypothetical protein
MAVRPFKYLTVASVLGFRMKIALLAQGSLFPSPIEIMPGQAAKAETERQPRGYARVVKPPVLFPAAILVEQRMQFGRGVSRPNATVDR